MMSDASDPYRPAVLARGGSTREPAVLVHGDLQLGEGTLVVPQRLLHVHALGAQRGHRLLRHTQLAVHGVALAVEAWCVSSFDRAHAEVDDVAYRLRHGRRDRPAARGTYHDPGLAALHDHRRRDGAGARLARLVGVG